MSFGRASSAVGDSNEDGSSAEAVLVNRATENGLVCSSNCNDGANNEPGTCRYGDSGLAR